MLTSSCSTMALNQSSEKSGIVKTAKKYLGVPYKFGGATPRGFDCSGLVQYVYKRNGYSVPRTAIDQFKKGKAIRFSKAQPGDLLFFKTGSSPYSHVVIYCGGMRFIHAPRTGKSVSIDSLDMTYWKKRYRGTVTYRDVQGQDVKKDFIPKKKKVDDKEFEYVVFNNLFNYEDLLNSTVKDY